MSEQQAKRVVGEIVETQRLIDKEKKFSARLQDAKYLVSLESHLAKLQEYLQGKWVFTVEMGLVKA